jgi:class 3 adenylate cyclase
VHIGRECTGVDPAHRILVDEPSVSRDHAEVRIESGRTVLVDRSTNGTRLNGRRVEPGERVAIADGDIIGIGSIDIKVIVTDAAPAPGEANVTMRSDSLDLCAVVVGDVVGYTGLTEVHGASAVADSVDHLFEQLRQFVAVRRGTVNNYAGDAILALWEVDRHPDAVSDAVRCALEAEAFVARTTPDLTLRYENGDPIRMGWAVTLGGVASSHPSPARLSVHGDAVNLAFRLSGISSRSDVAPVIVELAVADAAPEAGRYGEVREFRVKGREAVARIRPVAAHTAS